MNETRINELFALALQHVADHDCSGHPYKYGARLVEFVEHARPKKILEIGTGMGYSAALLAESSPEAHVWTIEKAEEHIQAAEQFFISQNVHNRITQIQGVAEELLPAMTETFDCIFFDGYGIHYEFLPQYFRLLKNDGLLIVANNHLQSKTSEQFFVELLSGNQWNIVERFGDTTVATKKAL